MPWLRNARWMNNLANIYLFKVNNRNTGKRCEICSKLTIRTSERRKWRCSGVFIVNFEPISHLFQVFPLLALNRQLLAEKSYFKMLCALLRIKHTLYVNVEMYKKTEIYIFFSSFVETFLQNKQKLFGIPSKLYDRAKRQDLKIILTHLGLNIISFFKFLEPWSLYEVVFYERFSHEIRYLWKNK